jgi:hypothetical protein
MITQEEVLSTQKLKKLNAMQQSLQNFHEQRQQAWKMFFTPSPLIEGSYRESFIRCGKPTCHCQNQPAHLVSRLSHWEQRKLKNKVVRVADRQRIKSLSDSYKEHKHVLNQLVRLNKKECQILKNVINLKSISYE